MEEYGGRANSGVMLVEFDTCRQVQGFLTVMLVISLTHQALLSSFVNFGINLVIMSQIGKCVARA